MLAILILVKLPVTVRFDFVHPQLSRLLLSATYFDIFSDAKGETKHCQQKLVGNCDVSLSGGYLGGEVDNLTSFNLTSNLPSLNYYFIQMIRNGYVKEPENVS